MHLSTRMAATLLIGSAKGLGVASLLVTLFFFLAPAMAVPLTDEQKDDIADACGASYNVCNQTCYQKYNNKDKFGRVTGQIGYDGCESDCKGLRKKCNQGVTAVRPNKGSSGGAGVLERQPKQ